MHLRKLLTALSHDASSHFLQVMKWKPAPVCAGANEWMGAPDGRQMLERRAVTMRSMKQALVLGDRHPLPQPNCLLWLL